MIDLLRDIAVMAGSCALALILAATYLEPPDPTPASTQLILSTAPGLVTKPLHPLNDGREPYWYYRFEPNRRHP